MRCSNLTDHSISSSARMSRVGGTSMPERLCSLHVYHQLNARRLLHWQIGSLGTLENLPDIATSQAESILLSL
jgi:hypothetical protein